MQVNDITQLIPVNVKLRIKSMLASIRQFYVNTFKSYDGEGLKARLRSMGIQQQDTVLVHANFKPGNGFKGTPGDLVDALMELLGLEGNLLMVSIPFRGRATDYLSKGKIFRVNRTISMMGLITESFRRKKDVVRSLHPTHPVLAYGKDKQWIIEDHENCRYPCGIDTPFDKLRKLNGKILFLDVAVGAMTFFHYMEDVTKKKLPFNVYADALFTTTAVDANNREHRIETYAYNPEVTTDVSKVESEMSRNGKVVVNRIGNTGLILMHTADVFHYHSALVESGDYPYKSWP